MYNASKVVVFVIYSTQEVQALPLEAAMEVSEYLGKETKMDTWSQDYYSSTQISETTAIDDQVKYSAQLMVTMY